MPEEDLETNEGADSFRLQIQGKWTDKEPKKAAVSAFFPQRGCRLLLSSVHVISL